MAAAELDVDELAAQTRARVDFLSNEVQRLQWQQIGAADAANDAAAESFVWGLIVGVWIVVLLRLSRRVRVRIVLDDLDEPADDDGGA